MTLEINSRKNSNLSPDFKRMQCEQIVVGEVAFASCVPYNLKLSKLENIDSEMTIFSTTRHEKLKIDF